LVSSYKLPANSHHRHTVRKARRKPFNLAEKTGLTRAAKIAAEWQNAELRHLTQLKCGYCAKIVWQRKVREGKYGGSSKSN
jgi:hypothetical protein